jgi:hypothetical protein
MQVAAPSPKNPKAVEDGMPEAFGRSSALRVLRAKDAVLVGGE